jgi:hypothetical protein
MAFRERLSEMITRGMTAREISEITGVTKLTVLRWIAGDNEPLQTMRRPILRALEATLSKREG